MRGIERRNTDDGTSYAAGGDGPLLALLPGFAADASAWSPVIPTLVRDFRVVLFDPPGIDPARPLDAAAGIEQLAAPLDGILCAERATRCSILGASMGGIAALARAATQPDAVDRLVVVGAMARIDEPARSSFASRIADHRDGEEAAFARAMIRDFVTPAYRARHPRVVDAVVEAYAAALPPAGRLRALGDLLLDADVSSILDRVAAPTLVVHGERDVVVGLDATRRLADRLPRGTLWVLDGIGHHVLLEARDAVLSEIVAFLSAKKS